MSIDEALTIAPRLHCPFEPRMNAAEHGLEARTRSWLQRFGLLDDPEASRRFVQSGSSSLVAAAYPFAHPVGLQLAADWTAWLFVRDDVCDEAELACDPVRMHQHGDALLRVMTDGSRGGAESDPLLASLHDLRRRMLALGSYRWLARFCGPLERYFSACSWEANNRAEKRIPDCQSYMRMRRDTGAVLTCTALVEITDAIAMDPCDERDPELATLVETANDVIWLSNDLFSANKELRQGDVHNLCIVLMHELRCDLASAIDQVVGMHNARVLAFQQATASWRPRSSGGRHFVTVLEAWIRASYDWARQSQRYGRAASEVETPSP